MALVSKTFSQIITFTRASGATWFNAVGNLVGVDFSVTSVTIGTGTQTFTLDATAGVNRSWATGDSVLISEQSNSANNMTGTVTSYTASTQVLVVNVTSTGGSGTIASWRVSSLMPRFDYNPSTLAAQGLLIEEARTNGIRNNTMQGAVAGTPGTLPTVSGSPTWAIAGSGLGTLTQQVVAISTSSGITYIDVKFSGTTSTTGFNIAFETATQISASSGQTWTQSAFLALVGGSITNISNLRFQIEGRDSGGATVESFVGSDVKSTLTSSLQRLNFSAALANVSTAYVRPVFSVNFSSGVAIDITLRIGLPQLEQGAFATSVIPTTTATVTRAADVASVNTLSPWYNASEGTLYAEYNIPVAVQNQAAAALSDGTNSNRMLIRAANASAQTIFIGVATTATQWSGVVVTAPTNATTKSSFAYATNDIAWVRNAGTVGVDTPPATIPTVTGLKLGADGDGTLPLNGWVRRITYYPRRLSNAELQAITL